MTSTHATPRHVLAALLASILPATLAAGRAAAAETLTFTISADDMCCSGCAKKIAAQLYTAPGVVNVKANLEKRFLTVTARPSKNLSLEKLWRAVEKGKGNPSWLTFRDTTYALTRPDALTEEEQPTPGVYKLEVADMQARQAAAKVASSVRKIRGIGAVNVTAAQDGLLVEPPAGISVSPFALIAAVEQAQEQPLAVTGPQGRLTIQREAAANVSSRTNSQGETR